MRNAPRCPSCERPVGRTARVCPYCGERIPGSIGRRFRRHLPFILFAVTAFGVAMLGVPRILQFLPFAVLAISLALEKRETQRNRAVCGWTLAAVALVALWISLDTALRHDMALLSRQHGLALCGVFAIASAAFRPPDPGGVASDSRTERVWTRLVPMAIDALCVAMGMWWNWNRM